MYDAFERDSVERWWQWDHQRRLRGVHEEWLTPDERLDEIGWDIFYSAVRRDMDADDAAKLAMDGTYRQRLRVQADMWDRHATWNRRRFDELRPPGSAELGVWDTQAPEQLTFWRQRLTTPHYVYFIQSGPNGPVKIGYSNDPERRLNQHQTGNPESLYLRHVIPGDRSVEGALHRRFEPARIRPRGEWFGRDYLPVILAFAGGLADDMLHRYDGAGRPPALGRGMVRGASEIEQIRSEINRMWLDGHDTDAIARFMWLDVDELADHLEAMRRSTLYDVDAPGGFRYVSGRIVARRRSVRRRAA